MKDFELVHHVLGIEVFPYQCTMVAFFSLKQNTMFEQLTKTQMPNADQANTPLAMNHNVHLSKTSEVEATSY